ncbi:adenylate kinase [Candidatus Marinimicrobia bacterium]|jgi:adenylate kinase|nr:adenylate kinase [Candidatus Neomarinimicrobiota bacterium]|tara:strand:- start:3508 stop:4068 length:561 start_codon:yes stop_codon:yes gene_type:complete
MRLIFLGPPGVGKGTQAKQICEYYKITHLSTGEIFRKEISDKSALGLESKTYVDNGNLIPDNLILGIIENRLKANDAQQGYLLDGFPRTMNQAEGFQKIIIKLKHQLNGVISLTANKEELIKRLIKRGKDSGRSDESPEIIRHRQKVYWKQTAPLLEYYNEKQILKNVDGLGNITEITKRILETID